ncbi:MAG TPA: glycosyltransferase family 2 protein [Streptosporangiaceae bacterium]|nr:glycosyltransferase family 2 protein [Streptosporangiaceae bacterium]
MIVHILDWLATLGIVAVFIQVVRLWFVSRAAMGPAVVPGASDRYLFAFLVPALNEERVIGRTLDRLLALPIRTSLVLVIDDGSDDATARLVDSHPDPRVRLLRRELPAARRGKGAALNAGFGQLLNEIGTWPAERVIVGIMDADGRLDEEAPGRVAAYFTNADVGAVQTGVRIVNRRESLLARLQDMEFVTYTDVFQRARDRWGVAGLGGNGQFVRLAAQLDLAPEPWTDGLTEDLEQGLRLVSAGWQTRYCGDVAVHQQGLETTRRLLRQRSRWFQGHLQAWRQIKTIMSGAPLRTVPHLLHTLMVPVLLLANLVLLIGVLALLAGGIMSPGTWSLVTRPETAVDWYWLTFALAMFLTVSVYARRERGLGAWRLLALGHAFAIYSLLWVIAGYWALARTIRGQRSWHKTERLRDPVAHDAS